MTKGEKYIDFREAAKAHKEQKKQELRDKGTKIQENLKSLTNNFDNIPQGSSFSSNIDNINSTVVYKPTKEGATSVNVSVNYETPKGERHADFSLDKNRVFHGPKDFDKKRWPKEYELLVNAKEEILEELSNNTSDIQLDRIVSIDDNTLEQASSMFEEDKITEEVISVESEILPEGRHPFESGKKSDKAEKIRITIKEVDKRRFKLLYEQGALFVGVGLKKGLNGYHAFVFDGFIVLENKTKGNAAYLLKTPVELPIPSGEAPTEEQKIFFNNEQIIKILDQTKRELIANKESRIVHLAGKWEEKLIKAIDEMKELVSKERVARQAS